MTRKKLIKEILKKSGDEFENKNDFLELAFKTKKELRTDLIKINNYILKNE